MKLTRLQITNYRSLFEERVDLELAPGMNSVIGANNCGKSNLLRALALALDPAYSFGRTRDLPPLGPNTRTRVVCTFEVGTSSPERTLLTRVADAERSLSGKAKTFADDGLIRFGLSCSGTGRKEFFVAKGAGTKQPESEEQLELARRAATQLRSVCRFMYVRSGDSLETLLQGRFRELLRTVLEEHKRPEYEKADNARTGYVDALRHELLSSLESGLLARATMMVPELKAVALEPAVTSIEQSLLDVDVQLEDLIKGGLADKGTGVRGAVLMGMLRYLAEHGRRSVVFAVEEPESFLHPAAQEVLREDLEALADQDDVTLIVTTHSPFIPSRRPTARLFALTKRSSGSTVLSGMVDGDSDRTSLLLSLFRSAAQPELLERATKADARAIMIVEGRTDAYYIDLATRLLNRTAMLQGVQIVPAGGCKRVVRRAVVFKDELPALPLVIVLDDDPEGQDAYAKLTGTFGFQGTKEVLYYSAILPQRLSTGVVEAEDLFSTALIKRFVKEQGSSSWSAVSKRDSRWGPGWQAERHYDLTETAKAQLPAWLEKNATPQDLDRWKLFFDKLESRLP